jgi:molybdopterin synthase catalytic subunit
MGGLRRVLGALRVHARQYTDATIRPMIASRVSIQTEDFNVAAEIAALRARDARVGAVCSFIGTVRDRNSAPTLGTGVSSLPPEGALAPWGGPAALGTAAVSAMELEHYPGMTEQAIESMIDEALQRFDIFAARVIHRVGLLQPLDQIVLVAVTSAHRGQSFQACEFLMDYLKTQAPFWKKETTPQGARWVDARVSDDEALARWGIPARNA